MSATVRQGRDEFGDHIVVPRSHAPTGPSASSEYTQAGHDPASPIVASNCAAHRHRTAGLTPG